MADATCRARRNRRETYCSDSPYHFDSRSEDFVAMKFASDSRATALAKRVLPVPGGPNSYAPEGLWVFEREFDTFTQHSLTSSRPPTSSQLTFGTWIMISRSPEGWTCLRAL